MSALHNLYKSGAAAGGEATKYRGFVRKIATNQKGLQDPTGRIHILRELYSDKARKWGDVRFEIIREPKPPYEHFNWVHHRNRKPSDSLPTGTKGQRNADVRIGSDCFKEYKGSKTNNFSLSEGDNTIEFLTDVVYFLHPKAGDNCFSWHIPPGVNGYDKTLAKMKKLLGGDGKYIGDLKSIEDADDRLKSWFKSLPDDVQKSVEGKFTELWKKLDTDELLKKASYTTFDK